MKHKHHITPRYRGGSDDPNNLIEVSITQHIMWHFANYKLWGDARDARAYKMLAGMPGEEERAMAISQEKKKRAHITREQMKVLRANGIALTEEGRQRVLAGARKANEARSRGVMNRETGIIYPSIREAAREAKAGRNYIKKCIKENVGKWVEV